MKTFCKNCFVGLLEKGPRCPGSWLFWFFLYLISLIYGALVVFRNFFYNHSIFKKYSSPSRVLSLGNIAWAGSGKTTLAIKLANIFKAKYKTAVLRRGYGDDEGKLINDSGIAVFSSIDRVSLVKAKEKEFDLFILDDGFQYRKLNRDANIVLMSSRELKMRFDLIPAGIFREPLKGLNRADCLLINYCNAVKDLPLLIKPIRERFPELPVFFADYKISRIIDFESKEIDNGLFKNKEIAAFAAIGYPDGFFNTLESAGFRLKRKVVFPDHHELTSQELLSLETSLLAEGIDVLLITAKDKYHLPSSLKKLKVYIVEVLMDIVQEDRFINCIKNVLESKN